MVVAARGGAGMGGAEREVSVGRRREWNCRALVQAAILRCVISKWGQISKINVNVAAVGAHAPLRLLPHAHSPAIPLNRVYRRRTRTPRLLH